MASDPHTAKSPESETEPDLLKRLEADDELRRAWVVNPAEHRWAVGVCAFMGGWGVVCGWIVFLKVYGETQPQVPRESDLQTFVIALFVAACVGFLAEYMQEVINRGRRDAEEEDIDEPSPTRLHGLMRMAPRMVFAVIVIALFDLYSDAWNDFVKNYNKEELLKTFRDILLPPLAGVEKNVFVDFAAIALLWIVVGAILGAVISHLVIKRTGRHRGQVTTGLKAGLLAGCVAAPLGVLAYVLLTRAALGLYMMVWEHGRWDRHVDALLHNYNWVALPVMLLDRLGHAPYRLLGLPVVGPVIILAFAGWLLVWSARKRSWTAVQILLLSVGVIFAAPLLEDFGNVALLLAFTALVWGVPAAVLGMSMPYLKRPSRRPRVWGLVAFGSATLLVGLTSLRLAEKGFYYAAVLLLVAGFFLLRSRRVEDYWPLLALCVAMVICEAMILMQRVTFFGVLERVHAVNSLPPDVHKKARLNLADSLDFYEQMKKYMPPVPEEGAAVRKIRARVEGLRNLPTAEAQLEEVTRKLPEEIEREKLAAAVGAWRGTSWRPTIATPASGTGRNLTNCDEELASKIDEPHAATLEEELRRTDELRMETEQRFKGLRASLPPAPPQWVRVPGGSFLPRTSVEPAATPDATTSGGDEGAIDGDYWRFNCPTFKSDYLCSDKSSLPYERLCAYGRARESLKQKRELLETLLVRGEYPESRSVIDLNRYALNDASFQIRKLDEIKKSLTEGLAEKVRALEEKKRWEENRVAQKLELSLTGSLGFWVTIGLLAGWAIVENQRLVERGRGGGPARCFWATGGLLDYHDRMHGVAPADDRELFRRLSLEILTGDAHRERQDFFDELFDGFTPERVASMSAEELQKKYEELKYAPEREALGASLPEGVPMVIDNAKRLVEFYGTRDAAPDSSSQTLLREWRLRADTDPEGLVAHVRSFFRVPAATPVGTFLQSVGLIPGAHFEGCEFDGPAGGRG